MYEILLQAVSGKYDLRNVAEKARETKEKRYTESAEREVEKQWQVIT